jgi:predicted RNase H-like HicB family nuclease
MSPTTIEEYAALPYTIEIIPDTDEGGFVARIKELSGCITQAETWDELWVLLEDAKELWLESALAHGDPIPLPLGEFSPALL